MPTPPKPKPKTRIQREKQDIILDAALNVFSLHGFRGATIDQIADAAGMSKPNLLYYFASTQVFPKEGQAESLDDHIMEHRRAVVFCVISSNLTTFGPAFVEEVLWLHELDVASLAIWSGLNTIYYGLLIAAAWVKSRKVVAAILIACLTYMVAAYLVFQ